MANSLPREKQISVLHHLLEGCTLRSTSRLSGVHRTTIANLMLRFGDKCERFMDRELRGLTLSHVEVDELWTFVEKKQARLTVEEKADRHDIGDVYVWTGIDQQSKLLATWLVGKRSADNARRFMIDLASRVTFPRPQDSGAFKPIVQISTDGFAAYPEAVDLAFGPYAKYGKIIKEYRNARMDYTPSEMVGANRTGISGIREDEERTICTSHVERHNLTIRTLLKRFSRLSLGFSKKLDNLTACFSMFAAYYNWVWRSRYEDWSGKRGRLRPPAAMMAGVTNRLWTFSDLFNAVMDS